MSSTSETDDEGSSDAPGNVPSSSTSFPQCTPADTSSKPPRSITLVLTLVPQGRQWLDKHQTQWRAALHRNRNDEIYKRLMEFVPYKFGVCRDYASLLATRDCALIKSVLGLGALRQIDSARVEIFVRDALTRGARPSGGGGRTNRAYWPRQLAYLEFVHDKFELQVTLEDLALEMGKTTEEASEFVNIGDDLISLVNEKGAVAFLEHIKNLRESPALDCEDEDKEVNLDRMLEAFQGGEVNTRRRTKHVKEHLSTSDASMYMQAMQELRSIQLMFLGIENLVSKRLSDAFCLSAKIRDISREHKEIEMRKVYDKGHDGLHTLPTREQLHRLYKGWWDKSRQSQIDAHLGLMNFMKACLTRADNELQQAYSDKMLLATEDFSKHANIQTPVPVTLWITLAKEGKPNKNNVKDYFVKLPNKSPHECAVVMEACMIVFRHDLLGVPIPNFADVQYNERQRSIKRPWYSDKWFCAITGKTSDDNIDILKTPYSLEAAYSNWKAAFAKEKISSLHVLHLPRVLETFVLSLVGFSREETGVIGKWSQFNDSQMMSYDKLPDNNLLARIAGFTGLDDYCPFWIQVDPPLELVNTVLQAFKNPLQAAIKRCEASKQTKDEFKAQVFNDTQAVQTLKYINELAKIFVKAAPFLRPVHWRHLLFSRHQLFRHPLYEVWSQVQLSHAEAMEEKVKDTSQGVRSLGSFHFEASVLDGRWSVIAISHGDQNDTRMDEHAQKLTDLANGDPEEGGAQNEETILRTPAPSIAVGSPRETPPPLESAPLRELHEAHQLPRRSVVEPIRPTLLDSAAPLPPTPSLQEAYQSIIQTPRPLQGMLDPSVQAQMDHERAQAEASRISVGADVEVLKSEVAQLKETVSTLQRQLTEVAVRLISLPHPQTTLPSVPEQSIPAPLQPTTPAPHTPLKRFAQPAESSSKVQRLNEDAEDAELKAIPPLSVMSSHQNPLKEMWKYWSAPWDFNGVTNRPLRELVAVCDKRYTRRYGSRGIQELVKKIRTCATIAELLQLHGVSDPLTRLEGYMKENGLTINGLCRKVTTVLSEKKLTVSGTVTSAEALFNDPLYHMQDLFWKALID